MNLTTGFWQWTQIKLDAPAEKLQAWSSEANLWFHGYWQFDWADSHVKLSSINLSSKQINIDPATRPAYNFTKNARVLVENAKSELDQAGEYYIDQDNLILYFIPPTPSKMVLPSDDLALSVYNNIINLQSVQNFALVNLTLEHSKREAIVGS